MKYNTVTLKSIAMPNLDVACCVWESHFTLVGLNIILTLGYKLVPESCDLAQGWLRYVHFKTAMLLQHFFHFCFLRYIST